jgi:cyclopropane fatty-acyl-phospholipid synthase-like methyltransferase
MRTAAFTLNFVRFKEYHCAASRLLEIGCARSAWLPYFAQEFGIDVSGLDYSSKAALKLV